MSIQYHLVFGILLAEMGTIGVLMLPLPPTWCALACARTRTGRGARR